MCSYAAGPRLRRPARRCAARGAGTDCARRRRAAAVAQPAGARRPAAQDRRRGRPGRRAAGLAERGGDRAGRVVAGAPRARRRGVLRVRSRDHGPPGGRRPRRRDRRGAGRGLRADRAVRAARRPRRPAAGRDHAHHGHPAARTWPAGSAWRPRCAPSSRSPATPCWSRTTPASTSGSSMPSCAACAAAGSPAPCSTPSRWPASWCRAAPATRWARSPTASRRTRRRATGRCPTRSRRPRSCSR